MARATLNEVLDFANKVREAGGGNPLDALMPAVPQDSSQCLIARNLNFNCEVYGSSYQGERFLSDRHGYNTDEFWSMFVDDGDTAQKIAAAIDSDVFSRTVLGTTQWEIPLPPRIGAVARDFDSAFDYMHSVTDSDGQRELDADQKAVVDEMLPYIRKSEREAYENATKVNSDGSIVV